jgi:hypothetical protein
MGQPFTIKSVRSDADLTFVEHVGDHFNVAIRGSEVSGACRVWGYTDCENLVIFFDYFTQHERCPIPLCEWDSIEGDFSLAIHADKQGHIFFIEVKMRQCQGVEEWQLTRIIETEFGQLPQIARNARDFFNG